MTFEQRPEGDEEESKALTWGVRSRQRTASVGLLSWTYAWLVRGLVVRQFDYNSE